MSKLTTRLGWVFAVGALQFFVSENVAALPTGFIEQTVGSGWNEVAGLTFASDGRMFVWGRAGRIWIVEDDGSKELFLDISDEVGGWRDYGLLGVALHRNFYSTGYVYLLYVVDHHHLIHAGTPSYNPNANEYFQATIGRITRYTANSSDNFHSVDPNSRLVLVGETIDTGFPIMHQSHGTGQLVFGNDGTLLAACGDGASYSATDTGGTVGGTYTAQALAEGIIKPKEDIGAYRCQLVDSLSGKVIRIDPLTGDGVPSNSFFDPSAPRAPRSRVWTLGLRNPCRMTLRPGTGSHLPGDADPGALYIGDVGWGTWEDLHVVDGPAVNCGWPAFEGMENHGGYWGRDIPNFDAPNPLYNGTTCNEQWFHFNDLIRQDTLDHNPFFPNPCDPTQAIPSSIPTFVHSRPAIDWRHGSGPSRTGIFNGNQAALVNVGAPDSPVFGPQFGGNASIGGVWYTGDDFPSTYKNTLFHADYGGQWIRNFVFDQNNKPTAVRNFTTGKRFVALATHPISGGLYYVEWPSNVWKVSYVDNGNQPPKAVAAADKTWDADGTPLAVQFTGSGSSDPEGTSLTYQWTFGDGTPASNAANPAHVFNATPGIPTRYDVTLTVTDGDGASAQDTITVSVNNTPPVVAIVSPVDGSNYPMTGDTLYPLAADISDGEHSGGELSCSWETILYHNNHFHTDPPGTNCSSSTVISPVGCGDESYHYGIRLTVTDDVGLSTVEEIRLFPNCTGANSPPVALDDAAFALRGSTISIGILENDTDVDGALNTGSVQIVTPPQHGALSIDPATGVVTYTHDVSTGNSDSFSYTIRDNFAAESNVAVVSIAVVDADPTLIVACGFGEGGGLTALDASGRGNDGTLENGIQRTTSGYFGDAVEADGLSGNVDLGTFDLSGSSLTAMMWFRADDFGISDARLLSRSTSQAAQAHYLMLSTISSGGMRLRLRLRTDSDGTTTVIGTGATLQAGVWTHVAASYDGSRTRLFQNGVEVGSTAQTGPLSTSGPVELWLTDNPGSPQDQVFDGVVDELRIYSRALDAAEIQLMMSTPIGLLVDDEAPGVPTGVVATALSSAEIVVNWIAPLDNVGVSGYTVRRDGAEIATVAETTFTDSGLDPDTPYGYTVEAFDASANFSAPSQPPATARTRVLDTEPPETPQNVLATAVSHSTIELLWSASNDNVGVMGYHIFRNGVEIATTSQTVYMDGGLTSLTTYGYGIEAFDAEDNHSPRSTPEAAAETLDLEVDPDLIAGYGFEEGGDVTVLDASGRGHNGTLQGSATRALAGIFGQAIEFDGSASYIDMASVDVSGTELSIMGWIRADDFGTHDGRILSKTTGSAEQSHLWMLSTINSGGIRLRFRLKTTIGGTTTLIGSNAALSPGEWIHPAATYDGSVMRIFQNGLEVGSTAKTGDLVTNPAVGVAIGANPGGGQHFDGLIDEVQIYSRALDAAAIQLAMIAPVGVPFVDDEAPTIPAGVVANAISDAQITVTWAASGDNIAVTGYRIYRDDVEIGTSTSTLFSDSNLEAETLYSYTVAAHDASGNNSQRSSPPVQAETLAAGSNQLLLAAYGFEEGTGNNATDASGNGHDGTLTNGAVRSSLGFFADAVEFDGAASRVDLGGLDVPGSAMTIMAWINADDFGTSDGRIISKTTGQSEQDHYWMLSTVRSGGQVRLRYRLKTNSGTSTLIADSGSVTAGQWVHAAATYDGSNMALYFDGNPVGSTGKSGPMATSPSVPAWIGNNPGTLKAFDGRIDELKIFGRALDAAEIQQQMALAIGSGP